MDLFSFNFLCWARKLLRILVFLNQAQVLHLLYKLKTKHPMKKFALLNLFFILFAVYSAKGQTQATFTQSDSAGCGPLCVSFANTTPNALTCSWTFGDGNNSSNCFPLYCYMIPGTYTVTLIVTTVSGTLTGTSTVTVYPNPVAGFSYSAVGYTATFTNTTSGGTNYYWDFGDLGTSTLVNPVHTYSVGGTYIVCLTAMNQFGCSDTLCMNVTVGPQGVYDFEKLNSIVLFPNPTRGKFTVKLKENVKENISASLYNMMGEKILEQNLNGTETLFDVSNLSAGVYYVKLTGESFSAAKQIVVE